MLELEKKFPGKCFPMAGLHPCSVKENYKEELDAIKQQLTERKFAAIGEIGIDLYWDKSTLEIQKIYSFRDLVSKVRISERKKVDHVVCIQNSQETLCACIHFQTHHTFVA